MKPLLWRVDVSRGDPEEDLALDEALLRLCHDAAGSPEPRAFLRFWESPRPFVVLGVSSRLRDDVDLEHCRKDGVPVLRRASGGGTVLQGPGCLNCALVLPLGCFPELRAVSRSYRTIVERCAAALGVPGAVLRGTCDLALGDRKVGGSAQKRTSRALLHEMSLLHDFDLALVARYLREPARQPEYRRGRPHLEFLSNLPLRGLEIREALARAWGTVAPPPGWCLPELAHLVEARYGRWDWTARF